MAADSYDKGFARGRDDALAGRPQRQPLGDAAKLRRDKGYAAYWAGVSDGHAQGRRERQVEQAVPPA